MLLIAFVVYDWLTTLDEEIRCFWDFRKGKRQTVATLLYGLSRYTIIAGMVLGVRSGYPLSDMVRVQCHFLYLTKKSLTLFQGYLLYQFFMSADRTILI